MTLYRALGDLSGGGLALTVLAEVAFAEGNAARVEQLFDESETFLRAAGSRWNLPANPAADGVLTGVDQPAVVPSEG